MYVTGRSVFGHFEFVFKNLEQYSTTATWYFKF